MGRPRVGSAEPVTAVSRRRLIGYPDVGKDRKNRVRLESESYYSWKHSANPSMSLRLRFGIAAAVLVTAVLAISCHVKRAEIARQLAVYRVGSAATFSQAQAEMAWFETGPDSQARLRELVGKWGTGNRRFDIYLAEHVSDPASSEALRRAFSEELGRRQELLPRWTHYWCWREAQEPHDPFASLSSHFDLLTSADDLQGITWREVLDLQAVFCVGGYPQLAKRLSPENWRDRYARWQKARPSQPPRLIRPQEAMPD